MNTREGNLASYLRQFLRTELDQLAYNRFFRATVTSSAKASVGYVVTVQRPGEPGSDGNSYLCATPGYAPRVGDDVECVWRDRRRGYVLWPLSRVPVASATPYRASAFLAASSSSHPLASVTWSAVPLDTVLDDPSKGFTSTANPNTWVAPVGGVYRATAQLVVVQQGAGVTAGNVSFLVGLTVNGAASPRYWGTFIVQPAANGSANGSTGTWLDIPLNAGDSLRILGYNGSNQAADAYGAGAGAQATRWDIMLVGR